MASYLARRYKQLGGTGSIVEVGAGNGRLAHHINATGFLPTKLQATDPKPQPTPSHPQGRFPVDACDDAAALARFAPVSLLLCAWMPRTEDWTSRWREARVPEYVLIGECADMTHAYNRVAADGYERVMLHEVSRHLLHHSDADHQLTAQRGGGVCCAVAFRRQDAADT